MKKLVILFFLFGLLQNDCFAQPMAAPGLSTIRIIDDTTVELCWPVAPSLNGNTFDSYVIYYSNDPAGTFIPVETILVHLTTTATIINLPIVNGPRYFYAVTNFNSNQVSQNSPLIQSMFLTVTPGTYDRNVLNWNPISSSPFPSSQGVYRVFRCIPSISPAFTQLSNNQPLTTFTDSVILFPTCNEPIIYRVELGDNVACSSISNDREIIYSNDPPKPPLLTDVTVTSLLPLQNVTLKWEVSPTLDVAGYRIYELTNAGSTVQVADIVGRLTTTATLTVAEGAFPNTQSEYYRVASYDFCGEEGSPSEFHHTILAESELDACNGIINLNWNTYKWAQGVAAYQVYVSQGGTPFILLATLGATDSTYAHFPLIQSTLYTYKIKALDATGLLFSESSFTELVADVPVRPAFLYFKYATVTDNRTVDLMLYHDATADISSYTLYRSDNSGDTFDSIATIAFNPTTSYLTYTDTTNCLTFKKSYVYRAVAIDLCLQPVYNSNNIAKTIFLKAATELDMENIVSWSDYENWNGEVRSYKVFRGFQGIFSDLPAATIPFGENTFKDDISNRISKDGEYCYYVQAYQGLDTLNFFADSSRSNKVCIKQLKTFYMPNAFQPDGINKLFKPASTFLNANNYRFQIFNKWGERVFETTEPSTGWDGTINGREARMDVYVYRITYQTENFETQELRGTVTLVR